LNTQLLLVGGEDHHLRIPFMRQLRDQGFKVAAAGPGDPEPFQQAGFAFHGFAFRRFINPAADWRAVGALRRVLATVRPDVVQSFDTKPNLLLPLAARPFADLAVIRTINGLGWLYSSRSAAAMGLRPVFCALHRLAARSTAATVFQNREDQAFFEAHDMLGDGTSQVIPGSGVDPETFAQARVAGPSIEHLRQQLGLGGAPVVLTVTRLTRQKGIPTLLAAAALVHQQRPDVRFLLVGPRESEGAQAISQWELDRHAPYLTAIGARSDVPSLLGLADVFAFPTEYREGVPRVLLEASLAELPIVTTIMPGCSDVINEGWNGYLVPPRSPFALAARILDVLGNPAQARILGGRARELVIRNFSLTGTVAQYVHLYRDIVAGDTVAHGSGALA